MDITEWPQIGRVVEFVSDGTQSPQGWQSGDLVKVLDYAGEQPICWNSTAETAVPVRLSQLQLSPADRANAKRDGAVAAMVALDPRSSMNPAHAFAAALYDAGFRAPAPQPVIYDESGTP